MSKFSSTPDSTASDAFAITPSDTASVPAKALYIGGAGNVSVMTESGSIVTFTGVGAGAILPVRVGRVRATGTTATNIIGLI